MGWLIIALCCHLPCSFKGLERWPVPAASSRSGSVPRTPHSQHRPIAVCPLWSQTGVAVTNDSSCSSPADSGLSVTSTKQLFPRLISEGPKAVTAQPASAKLTGSAAATALLHAFTFLPEDLARSRALDLKSQLTHQFFPRFCLKRKVKLLVRWA